MPRYDYECDTCHHSFELRQGFDAEPVATCPRCESLASRKFHSVPIVFKGSGWYVNDHGKRGAGSASESKESDSKSEAKAEAKSKDSDSKAKAESKASKAESAPAKSKDD